MELTNIFSICLAKFRSICELQAIISINDVKKWLSNILRSEIQFDTFTRSDKGMHQFDLTRKYSKS